MKFTLEIELGNDAMQTDRDVATALKIVGKRIQGVNMKEAGQYAPVMDDNGDKVGKWSIAEDKVAPVVYDDDYWPPPMR